MEKIIEVQNHCQNETGDIEISNGIQERLESVDWMAVFLKNLTEITKDKVRYWTNSI